MKKPKTQTRKFPFLFMIVVLGVINLITIDVYILSRFISSKTNVLGATNSACPQACISLINQSSSSGASAHEYFVPLGTGSNQTDDWVDVEGAQGYIDSSQYKKIKKVTFEATLEVPQGAQTSYVRLFNATDKHPVWFSEMSMNESGPKLLISEPITLDPGSKLYKVQMKSQLKIQTNLLQSRIHIITN
jgi:hypothetical protein